MTVALFLLFGMSGCATRPALRSASIALGAAVLAGAVATHGDSHGVHTDVPPPSNPCLANPEHCR